MSKILYQTHGGWQLLFQIRGAATSNDLSPSPVLVRGTTNDSAADERRRWPPSDTNWHRYSRLTDTV